MRGRHLFALVALSLCTACPSQGPAPASSATPSSAPALSAAATALDAGADAPAIQPDLASVPPPARIPVDLQDELDRAVSLAIEKGEVPGAVVLLGDEQGPIFRRAYGRRAIEPQSLPMQESTLFDLASLTKPLVTGMLALKLVEDGKLGLDVPLERYLPELRDGSRQSVTVRQLLTHTSGLPPVNVLKHYQGSRDDIVKRALSVAPRRGAADGGHEPYAYSDLGFIWLMHLIERVSGQRLDELAQARLFAPLKLTSTTFNPPPELAQRSALTEPFGDAGFQPGKVHDPRARGLSGVSGHAGLFSTADDLGRYAKALLARDPVLLTTKLFEQMIAPQDLGKAVRGLGWQMWKRAPHLAYGHYGFTGTSLWVYPSLKGYAVVLTNRVHPDGKGEANPLRERIHRLAPKAFKVAIDRKAPPLLGIDVLRRDGYGLLENARVGLISNRSARARDGRTTIELLAAAENVNLVALLSAEHGISGKRETLISGGKHASIEVRSLFHEKLEPTPEQLADLDVVVFDLQDVGTRFYTYLSTLLAVMRVASKSRPGLRVVVLDRPNPLGGVRVEGPVVDARRLDFVNYHRLPIRHGMTAGEVATLLVAENELNVKLEVVRLEGWKRDQYWDDLGLVWAPPSPNLLTARQALLYPGIGVFERTNISVGRGTRYPFEVVGAPWLQPSVLLPKLQGIPGVQAEAVSFVPTKSMFEGKACQGVRFTVLNPIELNPVSLGMRLAAALLATHRDQWEPKRLRELLGHGDTLTGLLDGTSVAKLEAGWATELTSYAERRRPALLYPALPPLQ